MYKESKDIAPNMVEDIFSSNSRGNFDPRYQPEYSRPLEKLVFKVARVINFKLLIRLI